MRTSDGCWTCRLRRKKCDGTRPACNNCASLQISCYFDAGRPSWMDGGIRQAEVAEKLKQEIKEHRRFGISASYTNNTDLNLPANGPAERPAAMFDNAAISLQDVPMPDGTHDATMATAQPHTNPSRECSVATGLTSAHEPERGLISKIRDNLLFERSDSVLLNFYLEHLVPFMFPFYRPSPCQGGKAWILDLIISSPVVRQAALCQSSYFFSLASGAADRDMLWGRVFEQTRQAFEMLGASVQVLSSSDINNHLHGAARVMASIMQVQRFEIAVLSYENCEAHMNAAVSVFEQLLNSSNYTTSREANLSFDSVMSRLSTSPEFLPRQCTKSIPGAEQAAFSFSAALLILDDIVASTALQKEPKLYKYHHSLLDDADGVKAPIRLETVVGCQNWALVHIGEIAALDAWKKRCKEAGNLDVVELVHRAETIKAKLASRLEDLEDHAPTPSNDANDLLETLTPDYFQRLSETARQSALVTACWAHAAMLYVSVVVSGWQPANVHVCHHRVQILELLTHHLEPRTLIRAVVWPFCVAGCLAEAPQEVHFRALVDSLKVRNVFGAVIKAFDIMEHVWRDRNTGNLAIRDLAMCFRSQGELVLLV